MISGWKFFFGLLKICPSTQRNTWIALQVLVLLNLQPSQLELTITARLAQLHFLVRLTDIHNVKSTVPQTEFAHNFITDLTTKFTLLRTTSPVTFVINYRLCAAVQHYIFPLIITYKYISLVIRIFVLVFQLVHETCYFFYDGKMYYTPSWSLLQGTGVWVSHPLKRIGSGRISLGTAYCITSGRCT